MSATRHYRFLFITCLLPSFWSKAHSVTPLQEEQARQAKQIKVLESERVAQELLLQEKGVQIKVIENFLLCFGEQYAMKVILKELLIMSPKKSGVGE